MIGPARLSSLDILIPGVLEGFESHEAGFQADRPWTAGDEHKQ
jgi:hypothetical protein